MGLSKIIKNYRSYFQIEKYDVKQKDIEKAVIDTCKRLNYAFVAVFKDGTLCGSRYDEPLIIGSVDTGYFISSDILGFLEYTNKAIYLENRDTAKY
jgi:glutamine---fructose-6-phosphate transaminase (isomerizing)